MLLRVVHTTRYRYVPAVQTAQHTAQLRPRNDGGQRLLQHALQVNPEPTLLHSWQDAWGNWPSYCELPFRHSELEVTATSLVQSAEPGSTPVAMPTWEAVRDALRYAAGRAADAQQRYSLPSHHVPRDAVFLDYAAASFVPDRPLGTSATDLMQRLHRDLAYVSQSTTVQTPALQALQQGRGVCQDFAHIAIACLRSVGMAARYVSGYLLTQPAPGQPALQGGDASHAWAAVYLPEAGAQSRGSWLHLDPTNNRCGWGTPGADYVVLAVGRDFADVSPLRGVLQGGGSAHQPEVSVRVTVETPSP